MGRPTLALVASSWLALGAAACGASLDTKDQTGNTNPGGPDGGGTGGDPDAPDGGGDTLTVDAGPDAPACYNGRVVYLNFDGVTLTQGPSDATQNRAAWMLVAQGTAPPYRAANANRQADIAQITNGIRAQLETFPITVVTQRPAQGPYVMIVFGGAAQQVGSRFAGAVQQLDCGDAAKSDVAWVSDAVVPNQRAINFAIGAIGFGLGLTATTNPADCMCGWDNTCQQAGGACQLSEGIARDPAANQQCAGLTTQDETTAFRQAFCQ